MTNRDVRVRLFGSPSVDGPTGSYRLTPFQFALIAIVCAEEVVSRPRIASVLWREDANARTRQKIRQLIHSVRRNTTPGILIADRDDLILSRNIQSDIADFEDAVHAGELLSAAELLHAGFFGSPPGWVSSSFEDWSRSHERRLREALLKTSTNKWSRERSEGNWVAARDAAESAYLLRPGDSAIVAMVIDARGHVGRAQAAEVAYSDFVDGRASTGGPIRDVEAAIGRVRAAERESPNRPLPLQQLPLVGRDEVMARLRPAMRNVLDGKFAMALILGEAGIGKTRVLNTLRTEAAMEGVRCLSANPVEFERRISLNPILDALSRLDLDSSLTTLGEPWRTVVGNVLPLGALTTPVGQPPEIEERNLSRRLLDAFSRLLHSLADETPTMIFIDDLHWADATTLALIQFLQRRCEEVNLGIVATLCPDKVTERDEASVYLADDRKVATHRVRLGELTDEDARTLLQLIDDGRLTGHAIQRLLDMVGCHPLYLIEVARDYLAGRIKLNESIGEQLIVPVSLKSILAARTASLSAAATAMANVLAVGSRPMRLDEISVLIGSTLDECADAAEELRARRIGQVHRDRVWILHDLFRSAIYSELSEAKRAILHRRLAERIRLSAGDQQAGELAIHFERGGDTARSIEFGWIAGHRAMSNGAMAEAAHFFEVIARGESHPVLRSEAMALRAEALFLGRDIVRANPALELAIGALRGVGQPNKARRLEVKRIEGLIEGFDSPVDEIVARLDVLRREAEGVADWEAVALALDVELQIRHAAGDIKEIQRIFSDMESVSSRGSVEVRAVCNIGLTMHVLFGDSARGLAAAREAVALTRIATSHRLKALLRTMAALQLRGRLALPDSLSIVEEARSLAEAGGDARMRFSIESNLAVAHLDAGELDQAERMLTHSTSLLGNAEMRLPRFNQANNHAELALARGDYRAAAKWFGTAERHLGLATPPYARQVVSAGLGLCALELGELAEARRRENILEGPDPPFYYDPSTLVAFKVRLLERRSKRDDALKVLADTAEALRSRLELAWLKVNKIRLEKHIKWRLQGGALAVAEECREVSAELRLIRRESEFHLFVETLTSGMPKR